MPFLLTNDKHSGKSWSGVNQVFCTKMPRFSHQSQWQKYNWCIFLLSRMALICSLFLQGQGWPLCSKKMVYIYLETLLIRFLIGTSKTCHKIKWQSGGRKGKFLLLITSFELLIYYIKACYCGLFTSTSHYHLEQFPPHVL